MKNSNLLQSPPIVVGERGKQSLGAGYPSYVELVVLWLANAILFVVVLSHFQAYISKVEMFGDNGSYLAAANAIRYWDFQGVVVKQFWGLPYLVACLSWFHLSPLSSLLLVSMASSLGSVLLARVLWGPWIACFFAVANFAWLQVSYLGGSDPLFVLLLFLSFLASRKQSWLGASVLAALATVVRPVGFFGLLAIGIVLILRREFTKTALCTAAALLIGALYLLPFWIEYHDPLYQFHLYQRADWQSGSALGWPFHAIISSFLHNQEPWSNVIYTAGWIAVAAIGSCLMIGRSYRRDMRDRQNEYIFAFCYLTFLFCYNSVHWARAEFPRFVIPALPFLLLAFDRWLPKSRYVIYALGGVSAVLGACSAIGIRNVLAALHQ